MNFTRATAVFASLALGLAACGDVQPTSPVVETDAPLLSSNPSATLLECPVETSVAVTDTINLLGGTLKVVDSFGGTHEVVFPANAVSLATVFTLEIPAGKYVTARVTAKDLLTGTKQSITFPADAQPTLAVSYKRCTRSNVTNKALALYNTDPSTSALLEGPFGAKEGDSTDPRVKGKVPHFSDYSIASP